MNKYNVRAVRLELDGFVRRAAWKKLETRFDELAPDLQRAVVEHRPSGRNHYTSSSHNPKRKASETLLHLLCHHVHANPPVPLMLLDKVVQVCPHLLTGTVGLTPLSEALERQAPPPFIECLLRHDISRQSLYMTNTNKETPLLQATKLPCNENYVRLLVKYDDAKESKETLLIPRPRRQRIPLFYIVRQELAYVNLYSISVQPGVEDEFPKDLEYMLLQTHKALRMKEENCLGGVPGFTVGKTGSDEVGGSKGRDLEHWSALIFAAIACAHFIGEKGTVQLIVYFMSRISHMAMDGEVQNYIDQNGDTVLHHLCRASHVYTESAMWQGRPLLVGLLSKYQSNLSTRNRQGETPLHLAIQTKKPWLRFLEALVEADRNTVQQKVQVNGQLPLHLAMNKYPHQSTETHQIWKAYPEAATVRDPLSRLFPFQLAAIKTETSSQPRPQAKKTHGRRSASETCPNDIAKEVSLSEHLSDVYFFLRASPEVLQEFVQ